MKLSDLRVCDGCGGPLVQAPNIRFDVIRWSPAVVIPSAVNDVLALAKLYQGSLKVAEVMVPDADVVKLLGDEGAGWTELLLCFTCSVHPRLARLHEMLEGRQEREAAQAERLHEEPTPREPGP